MVTSRMQSKAFFKCPLQIKSTEGKAHVFRSWCFNETFIDQLGMEVRNVRSASACCSHYRNSRQIGSIITGIITWLITRSRAEGRAKRVETELVETSKKLREELTQTFGFKVGHALWKMELIDVDGNARLTSYDKGVKVTQMGYTIPHIPISVWYKAQHS